VTDLAADNSLRAHEARAAGLDLWHASHQYGKTLVYAEAGLATMVMVGMVARSRAFLRAAYALADDGYELEAMLQVRALNEYAITLHWLIDDADYNALLLAIDNLRSLLLIDEEVSALPEAVPILTDAKRAEYESERDRLKGKLLAMSVEGDERPDKLPSMFDRAKAAKMLWNYSLAYRADSQGAAHPTIWAFEQFVEVAPDGRGLIVHDKVAPGRPITSPYKGAVVPFAWILATAAEQAGDEDFANRVEAIVARLPGGVGGWQKLKEAADLPEPSSSG
jgi:hypothetical protein